MAYIPQEIRERLPEWKADHGEVFFVPQGSSGFVLRTFTLGEYERFRAKQQVDNDLAETELVQSCLLYPEGYDVGKLTTGDFLILVGKLMEVSPFDNSERFIQKLGVYREQATSLIDAIYVHIAAAFPSMTVFEIRKLSCDEIIHHLALAEKILQRKLEIEGDGVSSMPDLPETQDPRVIHAQRAALAKKRMMRRRAAQQGRRVEDLDANPDAPERLSLLKDMQAMEQALGPRNPDAPA